MNHFRKIKFEKVVVIWRGNWLVSVSERLIKLCKNDYCPRVVVRIWTSLLFNYSLAPYSGRLSTGCLRLFVKRFNHGMSRLARVNLSWLRPVTAVPLSLRNATVFVSRLDTKWSGFVKVHKTMMILALGSFTAIRSFPQAKGLVPFDMCLATFKKHQNATTFIHLCTERQTNITWQNLVI